MGFLNKLCTDNDVHVDKASITKEKICYGLEINRSHNANKLALASYCCESNQNSNEAANPYRNDVK